MDKTLSESDIMSELVSPDGGGFAPDAARALLTLQFTPRQVARLNELAEKNSSDSLSDLEKDEFGKIHARGQFPEPRQGEGTSIACQIIRVDSHE